VTDAGVHLTESERQLLAEASSSPSTDDAGSAHLRECAACAEDVGRLRALMTRARELPHRAAVPDDLWPSIRSRIEARKIVTMNADATALRSGPPPRRGVRRTIAAVGALATLTAAAVVLGITDNRTRRGVARVDSTLELPAVPTSMVADSTSAYEEESKQLLDRLELQRALLRPEAAQALDADLRTIDAAIAELEDAIARDPKNPALRQLLASSYRQKVELLKRAGNAG
jgi:PIN domain nuclease of toxin-antitoxin system